MKSTTHFTLAACVLAGQTTQAALLTNGGFDDLATVTDNVTNGFSFDETPLGVWQGPGNGWDAFDDGSTSNNVARVTDNNFDILVQAISGAGITEDLTLTFDLFSLDEDTPLDNSDNNALQVRVFGVVGSGFDFDVAGSFTDTDFANDTSDDTLIELASFTPNLANTTVDETFVVPVDIDAGGSIPPFDFIIVGFAGNVDNLAPLPATNISVLELDNVSLNVIPEPGSLLLLVAGVGTIASRRRRA